MVSFVDSVVAANKELHKIVGTKRDDFYRKDNGVGAGGDVSMGIDLIAEHVFVKHLESFGKIDSEESGIIGSGDATIYIDPIDGSSNFSSNFPYFGTSVAYEKDGSVEVGVICNLASGEIFIKTKDSFLKGSILNDKYQEVSKNNHSSVGIFEKSYAYPSECSKLNALGLKYRSPGAGAISLAMTHEVSFLLYIGRLRSYDAKAGLFMCEELFCDIEDGFLLVSKDKNIYNSIRAALGR